MVAMACRPAVAAQDFLIGPAPVASHSGQFIIHAQPEVGHPSWVASNLATNRSLLRLDPALLAVSCERIKQSLCHQLGLGSAWRGRIYIEITRTPLAEQNVTITSQRFNNSWQYQLELPDPIERIRYVRAVVQALLLEAANRDSSGRLSEVPLWLAEGLAQQILASKEIEIILAPPRDLVNGVSASTQRAVEARENPLAEARSKMGARSPLTFDELSWPAPDAATTGPNDLYSASAQMFVGELLNLQDGKTGLRTMVTQLPQFYNWQFAFLRAFQSHFSRPLDVEKWWALSVASLNGRDAAKMLTTDDSWRKLNDAVLTPQEVREGTNSPVREVWTLQGIIREWPLDRQAQILTTRLLELESLRAHASQDVVMLVQDYCQVLTAYLRNEHKGSGIANLGKGGAASQIGQETLSRLDALDDRRRAMHPAPAPIAAGQVPQLSGPTP